MLLGLIGAVAPGRVEAADQMPAIEGIGAPISFERRLLAIELIADLEVFLDPRVAQPGISLALADVLLRASVDVDGAEEGQLRSLFITTL